MYRRFQLPVTLIALVFLWLLIVVPIGSGQSFNDISWGTFYNRHGWAAFAVMMLFYVEPEDQKRYDRWLDSCILASLAVFLLYTKITFGLIGVWFIFANMVISRYNRFISYISIIIIIGAIAFTEVVFEFNGEYFDNIFLVAASNSILRGGYWGLLQTLIAHAWVFGACAGAILATVVAGSRSFLDWAYVLGGFAASIVLLETSGTGKGLPALIAVFVCCGELARRAEIGREPSGAYSGWRNHAGSLACLFLLLVFISEPVSNRIIAWHDHYTKTTRGTLEPLPGLPPALSGFLVRVEPWNLHDTLAHDESAHSFLARARHISANTLSPYEYLLTIIEGVELLRTTELRDRTLFVLDNADPFTVALNMKPTENGYPLFWPNTLLTRKSHPQGQEMFSGVDYVMAPILPHDPATVEIMTDIYGDYLDREFVELRRSPHWRLLARK